MKTKEQKKNIPFKLFFLATVSYHKPKKKANKCAYKVYCDKIHKGYNIYTIDEKLKLIPTFIDAILHQT